MINLIWDEGFKRKYKKLIHRNSQIKEDFNFIMQLFVENPHNQILKTHKLLGNLKGCWSSSINYEYRIVFEKIDANNILLIDIGSHDEVY